jgi:hypothetical protein
MTALGVHGDPGGWQHAGDTLGAAVNQLTAQLETADAAGGSGLLPAWHGPVAESYAAAWRARHQRYGDLIYQVRRASGALIDFGERLADFQVRAARLESHWLSTGLHLTADGLRFTLPHGYVSLTEEVLATLRGFEAEAAGDVAAMWRDIAGAVVDLVTILESVIDAVADFEAISYTAVTAAVAASFSAMAADWKKDPLGTLADLGLHEIGTVVAEADHNLRVAKVLAAEWAEDADPDVRAAGASLLSDAQDGVDAVKGLRALHDVGGPALTAVTAAFTVADTAKTARKVGWVNAIEDHSYDWGSLAAGLVVGAATDALMGTAVMVGAAAAAPVLVPVGVFVVGGLVTAGVGVLVEHEVKNHRAGTTRALTDIGQGITNAVTWTGQQTGLVAQPAG